MTDKEKIIKYLDYKGISKNKFYKKTGLSVGFLDSGNSLGVDKLRLIIDNYHDFNPEWLITGNGEMLKKEGPSVSLHLTKTDTIQATTQKVPYYSITATASIVEAFTNNSPEIPMEHISIPNLPKCDGALNITGDSMYPLLKSGDIVMYRNVSNVFNIIWGEMYLMYLNCEGDEFFFCKYIHKSDREGYVKLVSQNKHHEAKEFPIDCIKQLAIVKASIRINSVI